MNRDCFNKLPYLCKTETKAEMRVPSFDQILAIPSKPYKELAVEGAGLRVGGLGIGFKDYGLGIRVYGDFSPYNGK